MNAQSAEIPAAFLTPRLRLRIWNDADFGPFAAMNGDSRVMAHFPDTLTPRESHLAYNRIREHLRENGYGFWALERLDNGEFLGFAGLQQIPFEAHFTPGVEIAWRIKTLAWNRGYATEAAQACLKLAFNSLKLPVVYAFTTPANLASLRVMEKLGMERIGEFGHPRIPAPSPFHEHLLFRLENPAIFGQEPYEPGF